MKHLSIAGAVVLVLSSLLLLSGCQYIGAGNGNIELTLVSKTDQGNLEYCNHYYSISGPITIEMTPFPDNSEIVLELPRSDEPYIISVYWEFIGASGETSDLYNMRHSFTARRSFTLEFTCDFGHGKSPQPVPADWTPVE